MARRWERTARLAEEGWRTEDIAEWMGISIGVVYRRLQLMGCARPRGRVKGTVPLSAETRQRYAQVVSLWEEGHSTGSIGRQLGVTHQRVSQILIRAGSPPGARRHDCHQMRCEEIRGLRAARVSWQEINHRMGRQTQHTAIKFHPDMRVPPHRCRAYCPLLLDGYAAGKGTARLAKELRLHQSRVYLVLRYHGVAIRPRGYMKGMPKISYATMEATG